MRPLVSVLPVALLLLLVATTSSPLAVGFRRLLREGEDVTPRTKALIETGAASTTALLAFAIAIMEFGRWATE